MSSSVIVNLKVIPTKDMRLLQNLMPENPKDLDVFHDWLIIEYENKPIGLIEIQPLTLTTGNVHLHISSQYQNQGLCFSAYQPTLEYVKACTIYKKLVFMVANDNKPMFRLMTKAGVRACGLIKNGIYEGQELKDLVIFDMLIERQ